MWRGGEIGERQEQDKYHTLTSQTEQQSGCSDCQRRAEQSLLRPSSPICMLPPLCGVMGWYCTGFFLARHHRATDLQGGKGREW